MRSLIFVFALALCTVSLAQEATTFILVRHAEKADDGTKNPTLTRQGVQRANELLDLLSETDITAIYSTSYDRTLMTVAPLASKKDLNILEYNPGDPKALVQGMLSRHRGGTVVVSGHSNTTPYLANALLGEEKFAQFEDADHGNLLIIVTTEVGQGKLVHLRY